MKHVVIRRCRTLLLAVALLLHGPAQAQLAVPDLRKTLPTVTRPVDTRETVSTVARAIDARKQQVNALLRQHRSQLDTDPAGELIIRSEVLAFGPSAQAIDATRAAGFTTRRQYELGELGGTVYVLEAPPTVSARRALRKLRELDPTGVYDFNHVYLPSAAGDDAVAREARLAAQGTPPLAAMVRAGLIDGGVQAEHVALRGATLRQHGCSGASPASAHATAVASLLLVGATLDARERRPVGLHVADVYCGAPTGGAVDAIVDALVWLVGEQVRVINVSLVGPDNALLRRVVERVQARGHIIVGAVGNDGPAAGTLYPAGYDGVVGVTGVDQRRRVLLEACRGSAVDFAAPGADIEAAGPDGGLVAVRGTSFAAPLVAGLLAARLAGSEPGATQDVIAALASQAEDLGAPGVDPVYGHGLVGAAALAAHGVAGHPR
jgi:subtilisin family serine protease